MNLAQVVEFHIDPQRLSTAILEFSHQANVQVIVGPEVGDRHSTGLSGQHSIGQALTMLLNGTALVYRVINDTSITVGYGESPALHVPNAALGAPSSGDAARARPSAAAITPGGGDYDLLQGGSRTTMVCRDVGRRGPRARRISARGSVQRGVGHIEGW